MSCAMVCEALGGPPRTRGRHVRTATSRRPLRPTSLRARSPLLLVSARPTPAQVACSHGLTVNWWQAGHQHDVLGDPSRLRGIGCRNCVPSGKAAESRKRCARPYISKSTRHPTADRFSSDSVSLSSPPPLRRVPSRRIRRALVDGRATVPTAADAQRLRHQRRATCGPSARDSRLHGPTTSGARDAP